jgi:DNA-binding MarR family transcriptional regulator
MGLDIPNRIWYHITCHSNYWHSNDWRALMPSYRQEEDLGFLMMRTQRAMRRWLMSRLEPMGLTYEQFRVLIALCEEDIVSQVALAERASMDVTSLARMLERMERAGLVQRETSPNDSRINLVGLTAKARGLAEQMTPIMAKGLEVATAGLDEMEVIQLQKALDRIYQNMSE